MKSPLRRVASLRVTLVLLLALAVLGAAGSTIPQGLPPSDYERLYPKIARILLGLGLDHYYTGPLYRGLFTLFTINLLACAVGRSIEGVQNVLAKGKPSMRCPCTDQESLLRRLRVSGFRITARSPLRASRRPWAFLGFPMVHMAPLAVLVGGLWGSVGGFVGTKNIHVGDTVETYYNWSTRAEERLPFYLAVEDFRVLYYPVQLRVRIETGGAEPQVTELREGQVVRVKGTPYRVRVQMFDPGSGDMTYWVEGPGEPLGPFSRGREEGAPLKVRPIEYRDAEVRRAEASVSLRSNTGKVLVRQAVAVNEPLVFDGLRIYLTAWSRDRYNNPFVGLQIVRDPGQPLLWVGAFVLTMGLVVLLFGNGAWIRQEEGQLLARASRGRKRLDELLADGQLARGDSKAREQVGHARDVRAEDHP